VLRMTLFRVTQLGNPGDQGTRLGVEQESRTALCRLVGRDPCLARGAICMPPIARAWKGGVCVAQFQLGAWIFADQDT
jgi:hypothetical protein